MSLSSPSDSVLIKPEDFITKALLTDTIAIDTETNGKDIRDGQGFAIGVSGAVRLDDVYYGSYFPVAHETGNVEEELIQALFRIIQARRVVFHNAKFDLIVLPTAGFNQTLTNWYCTMMMAHFLNENIPKTLDWLSANVLKEGGKHKPADWEFFFLMYGWSPKFPAEVMAKYASQDAIKTLKLFYLMYPHFVKSGFDGSQV